MAKITQNTAVGVFSLCLMGNLEDQWVYTVDVHGVNISMRG